LGNNKAGIVLLAILDVLDHYTVDDLRHTASICFAVLKEIGFV